MSDFLSVTDSAPVGRLLQDSFKLFVREGVENVQRLAAERAGTSYDPNPMEWDVTPEAKAALLGPHIVRAFFDIIGRHGSRIWWRVAQHLLPSSLVSDLAVEAERVASAVWSQMLDCAPDYVTEPLDAEAIGRMYRDM